ncbi:MAG TPA: E3 binding domain-containing protein, partial [Tepidisphaeraceae bacterium]|nr:E3 binding domain-containing protein [Tepidisphaeraceae bacterium]
MATDVKVPSLGDSVTEAVLLKWHKKDGEFVKLDEPIAELETDKANADLPAPASGLFKLLVKPGTTVKVGQTVGTIDESGKASAPTTTNSSSSSSAPSASTKVEAKSSTPEKPARSNSLDDLSPATRRAVQDAGIDPTKVPATGPGGRLTKEDVEKYVSANKVPFSNETVRPEVTIGKPTDQTSVVTTTQPTTPQATSAATVSAVPASPGTRR